MANGGLAGVSRFQCEPHSYVRFRLCEISSQGQRPKGRIVFVPWKNPIGQSVPRLKVRNSYLNLGINALDFYV